MALLRICIAAMLMGMLVFLGCAATRIVYDVSEIEQSEIRLVEDHRIEVSEETSAQFVQMTIRSPDLTKRFNVEMYHRNDTTSIFTGGFLGKGSFKGLLTAMDLALLFPGEKQYFDGALVGMTDPDLSRYEYVLRRVRGILAGDLLCAGSGETLGDLCGMWHQELSVRKDHIRQIIYRSLSDPIEIEVKLFKFKREFPFYQISQLKVTNSETGTEIKLKFIEQKFGPVPEIKFQMPDTDGWERIDYFELK